MVARLSALMRTRTRKRPASQRAYLRLNQHEIDEQHDKVVLDIFVGELVALRALRQPYAFAERPVVRLGVLRVQCLHRVPAFDAYGHCIAGGRL